MDVAGQALGILFVFALLGLAVWKLGGRPASIPWVRKSAEGRLLQAVERIPLTPQHAVHVVRYQGRNLVIATHPQGCTVLTKDTQ